MFRGGGLGTNIPPHPVFRFWGKAERMVCGGTIRDLGSQWLTLESATSESGWGTRFARSVLWGLDRFAGDGTTVPDDANLVLRYNQSLLGNTMKVCDASGRQTSGGTA